MVQSRNLSEVVSFCFRPEERYSPDPQTDRASETDASEATPACSLDGGQGQNLPRDQAGQGSGAEGSSQMAHASTEGGPGTCGGSSGSPWSRRIVCSGEFL